MPLLDFASIAEGLEKPWKSSIIGNIGPAKIKVVRMDQRPLVEETHDYNEALVVLDGSLKLNVDGDEITVLPGQMYLAIGGTPHTVLPGSHGTLVIIDV